MKARNQNRQGGAKRALSNHTSFSEEPSTAPKTPGPSAAWFAYPGLSLLAAAALLALLAQTSPSAGQALARHGLTAGPLGALGLALLAAAALLQLQNRSSTQLQRLEEALDQIAADNTVIRTNLADLGSIDVAAKLAQVAGGLAPTEIKDSLDKADEKLNNLTRAIRMFSQPLQDVSQANDELKSDVDRLQQNLKELTSSVETVLIRLEDLCASLPTRTGRELEERLSESLPDRLAAVLVPLQTSLTALTDRKQPSPPNLTDELKSLSNRLSTQLDQACERLCAFNAQPPTPTRTPLAAAPPPPAPPAPEAPAALEASPKGNESVLTAIQKLKMMRGS